MHPEIEAATALLEVWDGELEELAWVAELLSAVHRKDPGAKSVRALAALAEEVCRRAKRQREAGEIEVLEKAIATASGVA